MLRFSGGGVVQGASRARSITGSTEIPPQADVVVIGGGLIGCLTALNLAERGVSVSLCEKGVVAGGVWSPRIAKNLELELPQLMIFAEIISVEPIENGPEIFGMAPAGYFRREPDGGYMFGTAAGSVPITPTILKYLRQLLSMSTDVEQEMNPVFNLRTFLRELRLADLSPFGKSTVFQRTRIFQPEVVGKTSSDTFEGMRKHIPAFRNSVIRERYAGALMTSLDNLGVISAVENIPGLYFGTGMLYGLTMSSAAGEALSDMITGDSLKCDLSPYRYSRFVDGTELEFYP